MALKTKVLGELMGLSWRSEALACWGPEPADPLGSQKPFQLTPTCPAALRSVPGVLEQLTYVPPAFSACTVRSWTETVAQVHVVIPSLPLRLPLATFVHTHSPEVGDQVRRLFLLVAIPPILF